MRRNTEEINSLSTLYETDRCLLFDLKLVYLVELDRARCVILLMFECAVDVRRFIIC